VLSAVRVRKGSVLRLKRLKCENCKKEYSVTLENWFNMIAPKNCTYCGSGRYKEL